MLKLYSLILMFLANINNNNTTTGLSGVRRGHDDSAALQDRLLLGDCAGLHRAEAAGAEGKDEELGAAVEGRGAAAKAEKRRLQVNLKRHE